MTDDKIDKELAKFSMYSTKLISENFEKFEGKTFYRAYTHEGSIMTGVLVDYDKVCNTENRVLRDVLPMKDRPTSLCLRLDEDFVQFTVINHYSIFSVSATDALLSHKFLCDSLQHYLKTAEETNWRLALLKHLRKTSS